MSSGVDRETKRIQIYFVALPLFSPGNGTSKGDVMKQGTVFIAMAAVIADMIISAQKQ
jgi:hypothetical protein